MAIIHACVCGGESVPNSAVPVLAAIGGPGTEARNRHCPR